MGSPSATGGSDSRDERKVDTYSNQYNKLKKEKAKEEARKSKYKTDKFGYKVKKNPVEMYMDNSIITNNPFSKKSEEVNRNYYETKVKNYSGNTKATYEEYIRARGRGEVDAMGRTISKSDNGGATDTGGQVVQAPEVTAPTTVEVSQVTTTKAEDPIELRKRRAKARGRTPTIMTGVTGATGSLTLGKPSLLGS
jgi:hypothetical protein